MSDKNQIVEEKDANVKSNNKFQTTDVIQNENSYLKDLLIFFVKDYQETAEYFNVATQNIDDKILKISNNYIHPKVLIDEIKTYHIKKLEIAENEYLKLEEVLVRTEEALRKHIKIQHQYKLHSITLQNRINDIELRDLKVSNSSFSIESKNIFYNKEKYEKIVTSLNNENEQLKIVLKSFEKQSIRIIELENRLRFLSNKNGGSKNEKSNTSNNSSSNIAAAQSRNKTQSIQNTPHLKPTIKNDTVFKTNTSSRNNSNSKFKLSDSIEKIKSKPTIEKKKSCLKMTTTINLNSNYNANSNNNFNLITKQCLNDNFSKHLTNSNINSNQRSKSKENKSIGNHQFKTIESLNSVGNINKLTTQRSKINPTNNLNQLNNFTCFNNFNKSNNLTIKKPNQNKNSNQNFLKCKTEKSLFTFQQQNRVLENEKEKIDLIKNDNGGEKIFVFNLNLDSDRNKNETNEIKIISNKESLNLCNSTNKVSNSVDSVKLDEMCFSKKITNLDDDEFDEFETKLEMSNKTKKIIFK